MTRGGRCTIALLIVLGCVTSACRLRRPDVMPARMIEPLLAEPKAAGDPPVAPLPVRLLDTQSRAHIGRRLLHQQAGGELVEDPVWRWSSSPARYLDSALRLAATSAGVQLVDIANAPTIAVTLIAWNLESTQNTHLVGAVELTVTSLDRAVTTEVIRNSEPLSSELPGDLAAAAGRLMAALATESLTRASRGLK